MTDSYVRQMVLPSGWEDAGTVSTSQAALATTQFAKAVAEALTSTGILKKEVPYGAVNLELRFYGTASDGDSNVINMYGLREGDEYYQLLATITLTMGTAQKGAATELWADGIVETKDFTPGVAGGVIHVNDNSIGRYFFKPGGYKDLLFIATTLGSTDIGIEMAEYSG